MGFDEDKYKPWIIESTIFCTISMILSFISLMICAVTIGYCIAKQDWEGAALVVPTGVADYFVFSYSTRKLTSLYDKYDNWTKNGKITSKFPWG